MIGALILVIALFAPTHEQSTPLSPCPNVFMYEPAGNEPGRWYGVVNLSTDSTLHSLWLNIVLDSKADILGNWVGDVTTTNNIDFKVENTKMKIHPGPAVAVRFFVQYNPLNKVPRVQEIRLNGREICNAKLPQPAADVDNIRPDPTSIKPRPDIKPVRRPDQTSGSGERPIDRPTDIRPVENRPDARPGQYKPSIKPEDRPETKPVFGRPAGDGPVYVPNSNPSNQQTNVNPYSIGGGTVPDQSVTERRPYQVTATPYRPTQSDDDTDDSKADPAEYFNGGVLLVTPDTAGSPSGSKQKNEQCGKVLINNPNPLVVLGKPTYEGQWPWQIALYQTQSVDSKYICGGTLVTHKHVITAAHCVTRKGSTKTVNKNTLTIYLGKHNLRTSVEGVEIRLVAEIIVHPLYNATSFSRDASILKMRQSVDYTDHVRPACLWPENQIDLTNVIGKRGSVVGWGFDETGVPNEELALVEMPVVDTETCIRSFSDFFVRFTSEYTYCAGYRDGTSVCNGDSGGGMVFDMGNTWYLRGLVSLSVARQNEYRCDPTHYVVFTDLAKFLPWIKQNVNDY